LGICAAVYIVLATLRNHLADKANPNISLAIV